VRGKVVGLPSNVNAAANEVRIVLVPPDGDLYATQNNPSRRVAADGSFDYRGIPAGDWTLTVAAHEFVLHQRPLRITDHNVDGLVIASQTPSDFTGTIRTVPDLPPDPDTGKPLGMPGSLRLVPEDLVARPVNARVYPDGTFTVRNLGASRYFVEVEPPDGGYLKSVMFAGHEAMATGIDFTKAIGKGSLQLTISLEGGRVVGGVKKEGGQPAPDVLVVALGIGGRGSYHETMSDKAGEFAFKLAPGKYRFYALEGTRGLAMEAASLLDLLTPLGNFGASATVADGERQQVSLTAISSARLQEEIRRRRE
jgi:hypothetical protein